MLNVHKQVPLNWARRARRIDDWWSLRQGCDGDKGKEEGYSLVQQTDCSMACWLLNNLKTHWLEPFREHWGDSEKKMKGLQIHQSTFYQSNVCIGNQGKSLEWSHSHYSRSLWLTPIMYSRGKEGLKVKPEGLYYTKPILIGHEAYTKYGKWGLWCHIVYLWLPRGLRTAWRHHGLTWSF